MRAPECAERFSSGLIGVHEQPARNYGTLVLAAAPPCRAREGRDIRARPAASPQRTLETEWWEASPLVFGSNLQQLALGENPTTACPGFSRTGALSSADVRTDH